MGPSIDTNLALILTTIGLGDAHQQANEVSKDPLVETLTAISPALGLALGAYKGITQSQSISNPLFRNGDLLSGTKPELLKVDQDQWPTDAEGLIALGQDYLNMGEPFWAEQAFQKASIADPENHDSEYYLGLSFVQQGRGYEAADALDLYVEAMPEDADGYELRAKANTLVLNDLEPETTAAVLIQEKILQDEALALAHDEQGQIDQLDALYDHLYDNTPGSPEDSAEVLQGLNLMAQRYLALGTVPFDKDEDASLVKEEMNYLAGHTYEVMEKFCYDSPYDDIHARAPLYGALSTLAKGDLDGAEKQLADIREKFPEADTILTQLERDRLKSKNESALAVWQDFASDGQEIELNQATGFMGVTCAFIEFTVTLGEEHVTDRVYQKWATERQLISEVRDHLGKNPDETIEQALKTISESGPADLKARASKVLEEFDAGMDNSGSYVLSHYLKLVSQETPDPELVQTVLHDLDQTQIRFHVVRTPFDAYASMKGLVDDPKVQTELDDRMKKLQGGKGFGDIIWDEIRTIGTDDLATVAIMGIAGRAGSATRLATFERFVQGGMEVRKAYALSYVAGVGVEGSTFWALNTVREGWDHNLNDVLEPGRLAKTYVASLCMIGGAQGFAFLGNGTGTALAKSIGMVGEDGALTLGGRTIVWGLQHGGSMGGMVGANQFSMTVGLSDVPQEGRGEAAVRDVFGYFKFALAPRLFKTLGFKEIQPPRLPETVLRPSVTVEEATPDLSLARQSPKGNVKTGPIDGPAQRQQTNVKSSAHPDEGTAGPNEKTRVVGNGTPAHRTRVLEKLVMSALSFQEANINGAKDPAKKMSFKPIRNEKGRIVGVRVLVTEGVGRDAVVDALKEKGFIDPSFKLAEGQNELDIPNADGDPIKLNFETVKPDAPATKTVSPTKPSSLLPQGATFAAVGPAFGMIANWLGASPTTAGILGAIGMFLPVMGMVFSRSRIYSAPETFRPQSRDVNVGLNKEGTIGWVTVGDESGYAIRRNGPEQIVINGKTLDPNTNWSWVRSGDVIKVGGKTYNFETGFEKEPTSIREGQREAGRPFKLDSNFRVMDGTGAAGVFKADAATDTEGRFVSVNSGDGRVVSVMVEGKGRSVGQSNAAVETEASIPGDIEGGASLETAILSGRAHVSEPYVKEDGTIRAGAPKLNASGVEMEANPADPNKIKAKLVASGDIPLMVVRLGGGNKPTVVAEGVTEMDLQSGNDVVVAGRSISADAIAYIVKSTQPATADAIRDNLQQEALIRAKIVESKPQGGRLTAADYRAAYRSVTGNEAPQGWHGLYEGGFLAANGKVYDGAGNPTGDGFTSTPGGFLVQIAGK